MMKFIDFFAGIGGFHSGLEKAGMECIGWCEFDKFAQKSYRAIYDTEGLWFGEDVTKVKGSELPKADLWTFGFPCQDVSIAGKQKGLKKGTRIGLCAKTLRIYCQSTTGSDSSKLSVKWPKEGTLLNGVFTTQKITESLKTENVSTLLDIMESRPDDRYYLSDEKVQQLLARL